MRAISTVKGKVAVNTGESIADDEFEDSEDE
jgi:hypothetical protein